MNPVQTDPPINPVYRLIAALGIVAAPFLAYHVANDGSPLPSNTPYVAPVEPYTDPYQTYELIGAHNVERAKRGLQTLDADVRLIAAARKHATHMASRAQLSHSGIGDGSPSERVEREGYHYVATAENIGWNYRTISAVMQGWLDSLGHRRSMLSTRYTYMGAAVAYSRNGEPYWCAVFADPVK